jgi:hypothetical protein
VSKDRISSPASRPGGRRSGPVRPRRGVGFPARLEPLEGRSLLSHMARGLAMSRSVAVEVQNQLRPADPHPGPILNQVGVGHAIKVARLYPYYAGAKRGELDGAGAKAYLDGQGNLVLTGIVAGTINTAPTSAGQEEFYVFGINRGLAPAAGPFPGRPKIVFDSYVEVSVQQTGTSAAYVDLTNGQITPLPASSVLLGMDNVKVAVPTAVLGSTVTITPTVNFWAQDTQAVGDYHHIASFAPEFRNFTIAPRPL